MKRGIHAGTWVQLEKQIGSQVQSHFIMLQYTNGSSWAHTGLSDNDIRGNQSDRETRRTAQRPNLRSVFFFFCHTDDGSGYDTAADKTITRASLWHFDWNHPFSGDTIWQENLIVTWFEEQTKFWVAVSEAVSFSVSGKISCRTNVDWRHDVPSMD